ncbi:MAG: deoxyribodipyrimidine photolyase [Gemmatimonadales bacterium]|nr:MAG: deoxyribodipyrimidine photolyase [Gemmatimonadales bacterium]
MIKSRPALETRIRAVNQAPVRPGAEFVLYWMIATRRLDRNAGLERAVAWARDLGLPLLVFEALRSGYRWASPRFHHFCIQGMAEHEARLRDTQVGYLPYVERRPDEGKGLLEALAARAAVVVTDDFPSFFIPRMVAAAGAKLPVRLEAADSNGILPLSVPDRSFTTAYSFRRYLQKTLPHHLGEGPVEHPLVGDPLRPFAGLPEELTTRWRGASTDELADPQGLTTALPLDREVGPVSLQGGSGPARKRLTRFLDVGLPGYAQGRNHPDRDHGSGLSPYLHWGHISAHEVLEAVLEREGWSPDHIPEKAHGKREGWWGLSADAEAFLDQITTWREMGYVTAWREPDHETWESLPGWARETLLEHAADQRPHLYQRDELEEARTHDSLWNAAQRQLRREGIIHNYLRMLWAKKILEWSPHPRDALFRTLEMNNRWSLDGRNPNSTSGVFWTFGRYDRGWPERAVYGKVRSMTSDSTRRKVELKDYLKQFGRS